MKESPLWNYLALFSVPLLIGVLAFVKARAAHDWGAIAYAIYGVVSLLSLFLLGLFVLLDRLLLRWRRGVWVNVVLSAGAWALSLGVIVLLARL